MDTADCWPLSHIWYTVVFSLIYPLFQKIPIGYQHVKLGAFTLKLRSLSLCFLVLWKKKTLAALGLSFCKVSAGRNKNQLLPLGGVRVFRLIQAPPPPVACLMMGLFLLFFVTWPLSLVFWACNSSRSFIHLVMMRLCMPMKYQAVTVRFIQMPGLACSQIQGVWGGSGWIPLCPAMVCCTWLL